ncbi:MAG: geranylgeranyl reductase family protein [Halobacteria archaeon]|nr:geranylgeranyl reductase family protein [Halobacteria archaeon]
MSDQYDVDVVVVGGGTGGTYAASTVADAGYDVALLERKPEEEAGHIACGDALKGSESFPDVIDKDSLEESFTNKSITHGRFELDDDVLEIPIPGELAVLDRKRYGEILLEETDAKGVEIHYDTVVNDVVQNGKVEGVVAEKKGNDVRFDAEVVVDAAGALSILQNKADFSDATFDTNVKYTQFCSAYREIVEVDEPVEWNDAIVFKPTEELGYLWYFPRTDTEINAGLGFQMDREPMELVEVLRDDLENRAEFQGARVKDKLGAALPTRRPYDSAVAPGFVAVGDAAGHVNPTTGGGIGGAAKSGHWAAKRAIEAISDANGGVTEEALWEYNRDVMSDFGKKYAAVDLYNIFGTAHDVDELTDLVSSMPGQKLVDAFGQGTASMSLWLKLKTLVNTFGHWGVLYELYQVHEKANELKQVYDNYPESPVGFDAWQKERDSIMEDVYEITGAQPKY